MRLIPGASFVAVGAVIATWLMVTDEIALRLQLTRWQFWMLEAQSVLFSVLAWRNLPRFVRSLRLERSAVLTAAGASVLAFVLVGAVAPRTNRIYFDEHIYEGVAQNLTDLRLAQMCTDGAVEQGSLECWRGLYNKEPYGYPYLLSVAYRLFGVHESSAHRLNLLCAVLLVWVVFLTASALFEASGAGAFAAVVMALVPQHILWSHTAAAEPSAALMSAVGVMAALHHTREKSTESLLWMVVAGAFAVQFRPESVLLLPMMALVVALYAPVELRRARLWSAAALGLGLCALHVGHFAAVRGDHWGSAGPALSVGHLWPNLRVNGLFYLENGRFPALYSVLAFLGLTARPAKPAAAPAAWFLLFWGVFLFFYAGSYDFGADVRFSLMSHAPLAMLAGRGAWWLRDVATRAGLRGASTAIGLALGVQFLWFMPQVRAVGEEAWAARADVAFTKRVIAELPPNSVVLTHTPSIFLVNGVGAAQMSLVSEDPIYVTSTLSRRYAGGVYLHWDVWCGYGDPVHQESCEATLRSFSSDLFREYRERDYRYAFYRLQTEGTVLKTEPGPQP